ncbi:hypothetical protein [Streptomyces neyagawaensis]|uniref:hypothetical protein n=1 Tax=Streptomyces neyagawaensis TaxID=42238 RepID=UPI0006E3281A|nr:hypothetical protein [Streptomyces neyagawaensis]MCL6736329.1 hypothetical protein [Streptomyces neyagawaensis]MDE1686047.1 hypothetical protein [Streptomyces neyagawaensis]
MNVSDVVGRAARRRASWSWLDSKRVMEELAGRCALDLDWDWEAPEGWGSLRRGNEDEAIVSGDLPLCVTLAGSPTARAAAELGCEVITVSSWVAPELSCSPEVLGEAFGHPEGFSSMDVEEFSGQDLWFATV